MTILYFQALIAFTLFVASFFGRRVLLIGCVAWTVFTVGSVFLHSLMLLQLVTVWTCFALFKREESPAVSKQSDQNRPPTGTTPAPQINSTPAVSASVDASSFTRSLDAVRQTASAVGESIALSHAVKDATASLETAIFTERLLTEKALERAQAVLKEATFRAEHGEREWAHYQEAHARYSKLLAPQITHAAASPSLEWTTPDFSTPPTSNDVSLIIAVGTRRRELERERNAFLDSIVKQVWSNEALRPAMRECMVERGGAATWACIAQRAEQRNRPTSRLTFGAILSTVKTDDADRRPVD